MLVAFFSWGRFAFRSRPQDRDQLLSAAGMSRTEELRRGLYLGQRQFHLQIDLLQGNILNDLFIELHILPIAQRRLWFRSRWLPPKILRLSLQQQLLINRQVVVQILRIAFIFCLLGVILILRAPRVSGNNWIPLFLSRNLFWRRRPRNYELF